MKDSLKIPHRRSVFKLKSEVYALFHQENMRKDIIILEINANDPRL